MPVPSIKNIDTVIPTPLPDVVKHQPAEYRGATVDTTEVRYDTLTTHVAGQAWNVAYLQCIRGRDDDARPLELDLHAVYQQYRRIDGFELKVTSPLAYSQDSTTKAGTLRGTANVYGVITPSVGDILLGDMGDGREGVFAVHVCTRLSHYNSAVYEIEYGLLYPANAEVLAALELKVVERQVFHKDFLQSGANPLLSSDQTRLVNLLSEHYTRLVILYIHDFFSREYRTLLVPNQQKITYDPFVIRFIKTMLSTDDHPAMRQLRELNVEGDRAMYEFTFWNCLETMDYAMLSMSVHQAGLVDITQFHTLRPTTNSIYYTGVQRVVYPDMSPTDVDSGYNNTYPPALVKISRGCARFREMDRLFSNTLTTDPVEELYEGANRRPQIHRVTKDDYYVFSEGFYRPSDDKPMSMLEAITTELIKGRAVDIKTLEYLCRVAPKWDNLERFYYFPVLFMLLRTYRRRIK